MEIKQALLDSEILRIKDFLKENDLYYEDNIYDIDHEFNAVNMVYKGTVLNAYCSNDREDLVKV